MLVSTLFSSSKGIHAYGDYRSKTLNDNFLHYTSLSTNSTFNFRIPRKCTGIKIIMDTSTKPSGSGGIRDYRRSIWTDYFLNYNSDDKFLVTNEVIILHRQLKEEVRRKLIDGCTKMTQQLEMVDAIQRLGVDYHFQNEIDKILRKIVSKRLCFQNDDNEEEEDLYLVSLKFRLLRQYGYKISCESFNKFTDVNNNFKSSTNEDVKGMLSLYEAAHVRTHGEEILDEALSFTMAHLQSMAIDFKSSFVDEINHALDQPCHLAIPRLQARKYFEIYERNASCNKDLLSFAKLDFNLLQKQHPEEISNLTRWWKELDMTNKLPLARDRLVESYLWSLAVHFEPEYADARRIVTKLSYIFLMVDDMFDDFGTYQELELFTATIRRWNESEIDKLPDSMKQVYKAIKDLYSDIEDTTAKQGKSYKPHYAKESMKEIVKAFFTQSKWLHQQYIPTVEEYGEVGIYASCYPMLATHSAVGMNSIVTKDILDWLFSDPKLLTASSLMSRYMDDISDCQIAQTTDRIFSRIDCYMKQHSYTEEEAIEELEKEIANLWKDINGELVEHAKSLPRAVRMLFLNSNRVVVATYKNGGDYYTNVDGDVKDFVSYMLIDPVPI